MSKAFTSEETSDEVILGRPVSRAARGQERPMTREGFRALEAELAALEAERRHATDDDTKKRLDHRLALLRATQESVRVIEPPPADGTVRFGSTVTLTWDDGRQQTLRLVGPDEVKDATTLSIDAPLARALLEQREGDEVELHRPRGPATATLVSVK